MLSFTEHKDLMEAMISFGGQVYPKFGNVIIMAGGAGSGKGFVKSNLVGAEGFTFDVDNLKTLAASTPAIRKKIKDELGVDLKKLTADMKNPDNVSKLHDIIGSYLNLDDKRTETLYKSIMSSAPDRKPNLIFDVTLKDLRKLQTITRQVKELGYENDKIHIVWVINDVEVAKVQNAQRDRMVPVEILVNTHRGASQTMGDVIDMGKGLSKYMDGDIIFAFNKVGVDSKIGKASGDGTSTEVDTKRGTKKLGAPKSGNKVGMKGNTKGGMFIIDANYFYIKRAGKTVTPIKKLSAEIKRKIKKYVPKGITWE
jgi:hypothetical protein